MNHGTKLLQTGKLGEAGDATQIREVYDKDDTCCRLINPLLEDTIMKFVDIYTSQPLWRELRKGRLPDHKHLLLRIPTTSSLHLCKISLRVFQLNSPWLSDWQKWYTFLLIQFDRCSGLWSGGVDTEYLDTMGRRGNVQIPIPRTISWRLNHMTDRKNLPCRSHKSRLCVHRIIPASHAQFQPSFSIYRQIDLP
jgi:hypothetical protein